MSEHLEPVVFSSTIESLFVHGLKGRLDDTARGELRALGFDLSRPIPPALPARAWVDALKVAANRAFPELPPEERWFRLGETMVDRFETTMVGSALVALARALGPLRTLARMTRNIRAANNYLDAELKEHPDGSVTIINRVVPQFREHFMNSTILQPVFMRGMYSRIFVLLKVSEYSVELERHDREAQEVHLRLRWKA